MKQKVRENKERANESWGKRVTERFKENFFKLPLPTGALALIQKKMFWKVVNKMRKVGH